MTRIVVLLATYNGETHLDEQLASVRDQSVDARLDVLASDDGSTDRTRAILADWQGRWTRGDFAIVDGPRRGFAENFRSMLKEPSEGADYIAFCDQDDVWMSDKLSVATAAIADAAGPALYCSRTLVVDEQLRPIGPSPCFKRPPHFANAIVQSIAGGNTMVLNAAAVGLIAESARRTAFVTHDWWSYIMVSGAGGRVVYDPSPRIYYRQHARNVVGHNTGPRARWSRLKRSMRGEFKRWNETNQAALLACRDLLTADSAAVLDRFIAIRAAGPVRALYLLCRSGIYRQLMGGNISLALAALLRKL